MTVLTDDSIVVPNAPAVPGLVLRHFHGPADYAGIAAAGNASRSADGLDYVASPDEVANFYEHLTDFDPLRDMLIAEGDGEVVGFARGDWDLEASGTYRYNLNLPLAPAWRGHGLRRVMLRWIEARLRQVAAAHPAGAPKFFSTNTGPRAADLSALLESEGYSIARRHNKMVRPLDQPLPDFAMPAGLELRPVRPEHYRLIWLAAEEAFRDHWGYTPWQEAWYEMWLNDPVEFRPDLWQVAWDIEKDEIAGQIQTYINDAENEKWQRRRGYTESISVRRPYRRRGLARAMIVESLRTLQAQGMTESALFVDAENISGATRLYEACGFVTESLALTYRKPLAETTL